MAQKAVSQHWVSGGDTLILVPINNTPTVTHISSYVNYLVFLNLLEINIVLIPLFVIPINLTLTVRDWVPMFSICVFVNLVGVIIL